MMKNAIGFYMMSKPITPGPLIVGYHIPTWDEVAILQGNLGGPYTAGGHMKEAGLDHWLTPNTGADDSVGFCALGSGYRNTGLFQGLKQYFAMAYYYVPLSSISICGAVNNSASLIGIGIDSAAGMAIRLLKNDSDNPGTMTDVDGNIYPLVKIVDQVWMAANLKVEHFSNGIPIPIITNNTQWTGLSTPGMCYYDNDVANKSIYGALYNRPAINYGL